MPRTILNGERPPPPKLTARIADLHQRRTLQIAAARSDARSHCGFDGIPFAGGLGRQIGHRRLSPRAFSSDDEAIRRAVVLSLQDAPYFYDGHVNVRMDKGRVVLQGFVFSDWDLRDAVRIATRAAKGKRVINDLGIVEGGRR